MTVDESDAAVFGHLAVAVRKKTSRLNENGRPSRGAHSHSAEAKAQAASRRTRALRREAMPTAPKPKIIIAQVAGSGAASTETPSRNEIGGAPPGVPTARNDSTSEVALAVKVIVTFCHGPTPPCGSENSEVYWVSPPSETAHCSVVGPVKPSCCPAAW